MYREDARNLQEFSDLRCFVLITRTSSNQMTSESGSTSVDLFDI